MKSNENSLLRDKKSRLSLEKSCFLLDRRGCTNDNNNNAHVYAYSLLIRLTYKIFNYPNKVAYLRV